MVLALMTPHRTPFRAQAAIVDRDDDDAFAEAIVRRDVGRNLRHPHRWRRRRRRDVHGREGGDSPRPSIFEDREIRLRQPPDRVAVLCEHRDVDLDEIDPCPEARLRRPGLCVPGLDVVWAAGQ